MIKWPFSAWDTAFPFRMCKTELSCEYSEVWSEMNTLRGAPYNKYSWSWKDCGR